MREFIVFLHVVGSIGMGMYLLLPFLVMRIGTLAKSLQEGYVGLILSANRIGQYLLIVQFLTGGYLIADADLTRSWMVTVIILFIAAGALTGIISKPLKKLKQDGDDNVSVTLAKINTLSTLISVVFLLIIILMVYRDIM